MKINPTFSTYFLIVAVCSSSATFTDDEKGKRKIYESEAASSSLHSVKRVHQTDLSQPIQDREIGNEGDANIDDIIIDFKELALSRIQRESLNDNFDCNPEILDKYKNAKEEDVELQHFINACDTQVSEWLKKKKEKSYGYGELITRMLALIEDLTGLGHIYLIHTDLREEKFFRQKIRNTWRRDLKVKYHEETYENAKRVFSYGDGLCVHMLEPPFDRVEGFMEKLLKELKQSTVYIRPTSVVGTDEFSTSLRIFILQKWCRKFYEAPRKRRNEKRPDYSGFKIINTLIGKKAASDLFIRKLYENSEKERDFGPSCNWIGLFGYKEVHRFLHLSYGARDFDRHKEIADRRLDTFVNNCLTEFGKKGTFQVYEKLTSYATSELLPKFMFEFRLAVKDYQLPHDQSINGALDIRLPTNKFKKPALEAMKNCINRNENVDFAKLFLNLLNGNFGSFKDGIFREPIYENNERIEYQTLEFLFHVFSIKGYKPSPTIASPLVDFYYLYKISEIFQMIPAK